MVPQKVVLQSAVLRLVVPRLAVLRKVVPPVMLELVALERLVVSPRRHSGVLAPQAELLQAHLHYLNLW